MDQHHLTADRFGSMAERYLTSSVHASGADLKRLTALAHASRAASALDMGCGAGHASFALARAGTERIVAYDLSPRMLDVVTQEATVRGHAAHLTTRAGPAEQLPFADASFDLVVTRYSAHHWLDVRRALSEAARVLKPGGMVVVIDVVAPESPLLDTVLQTVEILRDASHVRDYRESEWRAMLIAADFSPPAADHWKLPMEFRSWIARIGTPARRVAALEAVFAELAQEARDYFKVAADCSFVIDAAWFEATKR